MLCVCYDKPGMPQVEKYHLGPELHQCKASRQISQKLRIRILNFNLRNGMMSALKQHPRMQLSHNGVDSWTPTPHGAFP